MNIIPTYELEDIIIDCGGTKPYNPTEDNWFIVMNMRTHRYTCFTVNDYYQAPERLYMTRKTAEAVVNVLNKDLP